MKTAHRLSEKKPTIVTLTPSLYTLVRLQPHAHRWRRRCRLQLSSRLPRLPEVIDRLGARRHISAQLPRACGHAPPPRTAVGRALLRSILRRSPLLPPVDPAAPSVEQNAPSHPRRAHSARLTSAPARELRRWRPPERDANLATGSRLLLDRPGPGRRACGRHKRPTSET